MKNTVKIILVLLLWIGLSDLYAQSGSLSVGKEKEKNIDKKEQSMDPNILANPQFDVENAGKDNPSRPDPALLPPVPGTEKHPVDIKASDGPEKPVSKKQADAYTDPVNSEQENGIRADEIINYRNIKGQNKQPESIPETAAKDYSKLQGSQNQPKGENPKK